MDRRFRTITLSMAVSMIAMGAAHAQDGSQDEGFQPTSRSTAESGSVVDDIQALIDNADTPRNIDQEPLDDIISPRFRLNDLEPDAGDAGDVYNVTNIEQYENIVAGDVYSPVLSTENVNKLYVDNSITYLQNTFITELTSIQNDIQQISQVLLNLCGDLKVIEDNHNWQKDGGSYDFLSSLAGNCTGIDWNFEKSKTELIADFGYNQGCSDAQSSLNVTYRYNGEDVGHATWKFAHANPHDRSVMFKPVGWKDEDGDGRDDVSREAYVQGYNDGYQACGGTGSAPDEDPGETTTITYISTVTPIKLTPANYDRNRSYKKSGRYSNDYRDYRDWTVGDYAYYRNVTTTSNGDGVDARITMKGNDHGVYVSMSRLSSENNVINLWGTNELDSAKVDFKIEFLDGTTGQPLFVETILTTGDLDGEYSNSEDVLYRKSDIESYSVTRGSNVAVREIGSWIIASGKELNNNRGYSEGENQKHWFSVRFKGSSVDFSLSPRDQSSGFGFNGQVISQSTVIETTQN
ncbi:hypothetical protein LCGC14_0043830 [marine sediment metagenome]|uniref:Secreted protein n=2 Tax=root TaxID=1 RepID=A0A7V1BHP6_9RHOB|nr:hypothetical protein [Sulfitobacter litoralis]HDZ53438.1 hypothetical protein [Sulfitobacter litoralis]